MSGEKPLVTLKSINGHLELYPERLVFRRDGLSARFAAQSTEKEQVIDLRHVTTVRHYRPQTLLNGLLIIDFKADGKDSSIFMVFGANQYQQVLKLRETIEDYLSRREPYPLISENKVHKPA